MTGQGRRPSRLGFLLVSALLAALPAAGLASTTATPAPPAPVRFDGAVEVRALPPTGPSLSGAVTVPRGVPDADALRKRKTVDPVVEPGGLQVPEPAPPGPSLAPAALSTFEGLRKSESGGSIPPDTQIAAGPSHLFETVNAEGRIFTKGGVILQTFRLTTFFGIPASTILFDPRIRFDAISGRWFVIAVTAEPAAGTWRLAVSATNDPTGFFFRYTFPTPGSAPDFPGLGIGSDKVVLTANAFLCGMDCTTRTSLLGAEFIVLDKSHVVAGLPTPASQFFAPNPGLFTIQPAHSLSPSSTMFMASVDFPTSLFVRYRLLTGLPGVGGGITVLAVDRSIPALDAPPDAVQPGTAAIIDTGDNRLLDAVFRNGAFWVAANTRCVVAAANRACLRFIRLDTVALNITQDVTLGTAGIDAYYPAIQVDGSDNLVTVFSRSSLAEFPSVYASALVAIDPLPPFPQPPVFRAPVLLKAGEQFYDPLLAGFSQTRWGDYSGAAVDPSDPSVVWLAGEYSRTESRAEWGTWIARFQVAVRGGVFGAAGNLDGAGAAEIVTAPGPGELPHVRAFRANGTAFPVSFFAFEPTFLGGVRVANCDVDGDGRAEIITARGPGGPPEVRVFRVQTGAPGGVVQILSFFAYNPLFLGGVFVACGDVDGDGLAEIITGADAGGGPHVLVHKVTGTTVAPMGGGFFAYVPAFAGGVRVASCDLTGDGLADIVTAAGTGGGPHVRVFNGAGAEVLIGGGFFAYTPAFTGGVFVACGALGAGGTNLIVTGADAGGGPHVRVFTGAGIPTGVSFFPYDIAFAGGVRVAVGDLDGAGAAEIITTPGPGGGPHLRAFFATGLDFGLSLFAY